jgi:hypothetical protein
MDSGDKKMQKIQLVLLKLLCRWHCHKDAGGDDFAAILRTTCFLHRLFDVRYDILARASCISATAALSELCRFGCLRHTCAAAQR